MKIFEIDKSFYNKEIDSHRKREFVLIALFMFLTGIVSFFENKGIIFFVLGSFLIFLLGVLRINTSINKYQCCHRISINENEVKITFIHPFYKSKIIMCYLKKDLLVSFTKNHSLQTITFQKNSKIFISNLFEISNNKNGWTEKQLKEILAEFK